MTEPAHVTTDAKERKALPICTGVLDYFPDALLAVAEVSRVGNEQHNPGQPLHWDKSKSTDEADALLRHLIDRGGKDSDGVRHAAKVAWRALALLQREIDAERVSAAKAPPEMRCSQTPPAIVPLDKQNGVANMLDILARVEDCTRQCLAWGCGHCPLAGQQYCAHHAAAGRRLD